MSCLLPPVYAGLGQGGPYHCQASLHCICFARTPAVSSGWPLCAVCTSPLPCSPSALLCHPHPHPPGRYVLPQKDTRLKLPDFELPAAYEGPLQVARRSDMDPNGHINNTTYLAWALETLPQEVLDTHHLKEVRGEPARQQRKGGGRRQAAGGRERQAAGGGGAGSRRGQGRYEESTGVALSAFACHTNAIEGVCVC